MKSTARAGKLLQSGLIFTIISFLTTLIHYVFQVIISRKFDSPAAQGEFGANESPAALFDGNGGSQTGGGDRQPVQTERQTRQPAAE